MAYSKLEDAIVNHYLDVNYPPMEPEEPNMEGMQLAAGPSSTMTDAGPRFGRGGVTSRSSQAAGGLEKPLTGLADLFAGFARGATAQTLGLGGDLEQLYNGFSSVFNRPEDQGRIDAFLKGVQQKTNMATTEQVKKEGFRVPGTDINVPALPPTIPAGVADQKSRQATANVGETFGEFAPLPGAIEAGTAGLKYGAKALAPTAANMMESGLRKSGMIMDVAPISPTLKEAAPVSDIGFYSAVEQTAANIQRKSGSGQSFLNDIMKGQDVRADEIKWMGLDDFLKAKQNVTKQEVQDYIANNRVDVQEVSSTIPRLPGDEVAGDKGSFLPKFAGYQLPGGENYRELLLTMPKKQSALPEGFTVDAYSVNGKTMYGVYDANGNRYGSGSTKDDALNRFSELHQGAGTYKSSHFPDQPNILAHLRVNDRVDADGKKMLLIEEVQSDWHQAGRDNGYTSAESKAAESAFQKYSKELANKYDLNPEQNLSMYATMKRMQPEEVAKYEQLQSAWTASKGGVPDAPFKDTWYQLALKRAIKYATDNGYERVGITTGKQQAERYDLNKQLSRISYQDGVLSGYDYSGAMIVHKFVEPKDLPNYVGKELGNKLAENAKNDQETRMMLREAIKNDLPEDRINALRDQLNNIKTDYSGVDLEIGGEGMKKYYDEIYPKFLDKYAKKWGAKVGETNINPRKTAWQYGLDARDVDVGVRYIDITPSMKASVKKGQPLFTAAPVTVGTGAAMQDREKK